MTQVTDYVVANDNGANIRTDINAVLQAIVTLNAGNSAPSTLYPRMLWVDETNGLVKIRNAANNAWLTLPLDPDVSKQIVGDATVDGKLTANDIIESSSGGFKFPDATVQLTKAVNGVMQWDAKAITSTVTRTSTSYGNFVSADAFTLTDAANSVLIIANLTMAVEGNDNAAFFRLNRGGAVILQGAAAGSRERVAGPSVNHYDEDVSYDLLMQQVSMVYIDTPGSTGPHYYKVTARCLDGTQSIYLNRTVDDTDDASHPRSASSIVCIELSA